MLNLRALSSVDSNAEPGALYLLVPSGGHIVLAPYSDGTWEVSMCEGWTDIGATEPIGSICAEDEAEARAAALAIARDPSLLPYWDAIDTAIARLDHAYGEDRISALFTAEPTLAIAV